MSPRPYAMVAYSPPSRTAETVSSTNRATRSLRAARVHGDARRARQALRVDDGRLPVRLVLLDHEAVLHLLSEISLELGRPAGQERVELRRRERLANRLAIGRAGLLDRREQDPRRLVAERLVPLRRAAAVPRLEERDEALRL